MLYKHAWIMLCRSINLQVDNFIEKGEEHAKTQYNNRVS